MGGARRVCGARRGRVLHVPANERPGALFAYFALLTAVLIAICWLKGEPPRWRWGND
jgi:uncharacterized membrane protein